MKLYRILYRSSETGHLVSAEFARLHPATTTRERRWFWQREKRGG